MWKTESALDITVQLLLYRPYSAATILA